jgi:hypothetical protein
VETPTVWLPGPGQFIWRVRPRSTGAYPLVIHFAGDVFTKTLYVTDRGVAVRANPERVTEGFVNDLMHPSPTPLPRTSPIDTIGISYPAVEIGALGWSAPWKVVYAILTLGFAVLLRRPLGVVL